MIERGIEQGVEQVACRLLLFGNSVELVAEACNLTCEEIEELKGKL